ncbi:MAG: TetR/AcrR family transcriptional regulator [Erysipelotrichaceae bacterium]|nr:TetR/AcrR family transcriptional regulator [Erysipelotrichaceae bacterium]
MYKTGVETRLRILENAKRLFYRNGYKQTSVDMICRASDAKLGTFTYYFPKKNDLLSVIYSEYMGRCSEYIRTECLDLTSSEHHLYTVMLYYQKLYSDPQTVRFHKEIMEIASMNTWFHDSRKLITEFSATNSTGMEENFYDLCVQADNAVRRELNLEFMEKEGHTPEDIKRLLEKIYSINGLLFGIDQKKIGRELEDAYHFYLSHQNCSVALLH